MTDDDRNQDLNLVQMFSSALKSTQVQHRTQENTDHHRIQQESWESVEQMIHAEEGSKTCELVRSTPQRVALLEKAVQDLLS